MSPADRALIDAAVSAGRVTRCPSAPAAGLSPLEDRLWIPPAAAVVDAAQSARQARAVGAMHRAFQGGSRGRR